MKFPYKIVDLTHSLSATTPTWEGGCGFQHETILDYAAYTTDVKFKIQKMSLFAGLGTHMDAPAHCVPGAKTIDAFNLNQLISPCVVIDVSEEAHADYRLSPETIKIFEQKYGAISAGSFVIIRTGWDRFWNEPEKYRNNLQFPSITHEAALLLLERQIVGLGIDTLSPDTPDSGYPVHQTLLSAGIYLIENVENSGQLPPMGSISLALPLKIAEATEAPMRFIALVEKRIQGTYGDAIGIRPINEQDIPMIVNEFAKHHWPKPASTFETYCAEQQQNQRRIWLAFYQDQFAGYVTLKWHSAYQPFQKNHIPEIMDLNVLPPFRHQGIASQLLNLAELEAAQQSNIVGIGVGRYADYGNAQKLYISRGYQPNGLGITYDYKPVEPGKMVCLDDDLVLWFTKNLK